MADIVITEFMDEEAVARLSARYDTLYDPGLADKQDRIGPLLAQSRALIVRNRTQVTPALLSAAPNLGVVGRLGVGLDNIDTAACQGRDVMVIPATGANNASVAEYVITAAMILLRGAWHASAQVAAGDWPRQALIGREIGGKTLGLVGFGGIAQETATRARALGMRILAHDPFLDASHPAWAHAKATPLDQLYAQSDVISLHTPLTEGTRHMIDTAALAMMKKDAIMINAARGGVIDEQALTMALKDGRLGGAALDVFETEPLTPDAGAKFDGLNVLLTPHIAGVTEESNVRVSAMIAREVAKKLG